MNKSKYTLPFLLLLLISCEPDNLTFSVYNAGEERIDSLHIYAGKNHYLLENIEPRKIKDINILIVGDVSLIVKADEFDSIIVKEKFLSHKPTGNVQVGINKDRVTFASISN